MKRIISLALSIAIVLCLVISAGAVCNHTYSEEEIAATCVERAHTLYTCGDCGDTYKEYEEYNGTLDGLYFSLEGEREGDVLNIRVVMGNNPGVWGARVTVFYNGDALQFAELKNGSVWSSAMMNSNESPESGQPYVRYFGENSAIVDSTKNGAVLTASFKIVGSVDDWDLSLVIRDRDVIDANQNKVPFGIVSTVGLGYGGHDYVEGELITPPTYVDEGEIEYNCTKCPESKTGSVPRLDPIAGDADLNGALDARDCLIIKSYLACVISEDAVIGNLDVNGDGEVNAKDLLYLKKSFVATE